MWRKYATPLRLRLRADPRLLAVIGLSHMLAAASLLTVDMHIAWKAVLWAAVMVSLWFHGARHLVFPAPWVLTGMIWKEQDRWALIRADGSVLNVTMKPAWYAQRYLVILRFTGGGFANHAVLLCAGRVGKDDFRKLRVRLRIDSDFYGNGNRKKISAPQ